MAKKKGKKGGAYRAVAAVCVAALCASCWTSPDSIATAIEQAQQAAGQAGAGAEPPATVHGIDVVEIVIYALAALGLGPVARILTLLKPVLAPILKAIIGKKTAPILTEEPKKVS
jgi:hypothetical protein